MIILSERKWTAVKMSTKTQGFKKKKSERNFQLP